MSISKSEAERPRGESMVVAGVMSGTSADGVDVAVCRIEPGDAETPSIEVLGHRTFPYPVPVREAVLEAMAAESISVAQLSRLNWRLGAIYAEAVEQSCAELGVLPELVGCHGQTIYHQAKAEEFLDVPVRATWQTGEAAVLAERLHCSVVSDFRVADLATGGQGAPLVPMLDWVMFRSPKVDRLLANVGGIANVTVLPAGCGIREVIAFDTGPGNMVIDGCMRQLYGQEFDENGAVAQSGRVLEEVVEEQLLAPFFRADPPKSCGREEFGAAFSGAFIERCKAGGARDADVVATAAALTVRSMVAAYERFVAERIHGSPLREAMTECVIAGGGTKNAWLMALLTTAFDACGVKVRHMEELGVAAEAKEAVAFALLAWLTWWGMPGNVAGATGASRPVVLGKVSFGW